MGTSGSVWTWEPCRLWGEQNSRPRSHSTLSTKVTYKTTLPHKSWGWPWRFKRENKEYFTGKLVVLPTPFFKTVRSNIRFSNLQKVLVPAWIPVQWLGAWVLEAGCPHSNPSLLPAVWVWTGITKASAVSLSFIIYKMGPRMQCTHFVELFRLVNETFQVKYSGSVL